MTADSSRSVMSGSRKLPGTRMPAGSYTVLVILKKHLMPGIQVLPRSCRTTSRSSRNGRKQVRPEGARHRRQVPVNTATIMHTKSEMCQNLLVNTKRYIIRSVFDMLEWKRENARLYPRCNEHRICTHRDAMHSRRSSRQHGAHGAQQLRDVFRVTEKVTGENKAVHYRKCL